MNVAIITEANHQTASGHLIESVNLYKALVEHGHDTSLLVNSDIPAEFRKWIDGWSYYEYDAITKKRIYDILFILADIQNIDVIITNLRKIDNSELNEIKKTGCKVICIDELGNRQLDSNIIINNMLAPVFCIYPNSSSKIFSGGEYLALSNELVIIHEKEKIIRKEIKNIVVSMGGVDKKNHTLEIVKKLNNDKAKYNVDLVLGGDYAFEDTIKNEIEGKSNYRIHKNIDYIYDLFFEADLAFTAGGNTLYELACIGTPTIIYPTMPHEKVNGSAFVKKGFGLITEDIGSLNIQMYDFDLRKKHSTVGKSIIDGRGVERIVAIVLQ